MTSAAKIRIDQLLVERGLAESREKAQALIIAGQVLVNGQKALKPGHSVAADSRVEVLERMPYVSRGGYKLAGALDHWALDVTGWVCLDVGASTGGFTDCLLQRGAAKVWAIDVGHGQIDWKLRSDARVVVQEGVNARYLTAADFPEKFDLAVCDASFISAHVADSCDRAFAARRTAGWCCWSSRSLKWSGARSAKAESCASPHCIRPLAIAFEPPSKRRGSGLISSRVRSWAPRAIGNSCFMPAANPTQ